MNSCDDLENPSTFSCKATHTNSGKKYLCSICQNEDKVY